MKKIRFSESQILTALKEQESGIKVAEICRKYGISEATFYNWKSKYSGMTISELKRLKELKYENSRLKKMYADLSLENAALKDIVKKNFNVWVKGVILNLFKGKPFRIKSCPGV